MRARRSGALARALTVVMALVCASLTITGSGAQQATTAGASVAHGKSSGGSSTAPLPSRCLARATPQTASYRVELAPVLEFDELMTAPPDAACWDVYSRNDTCVQSAGTIACGMGNPTALRVQVANKCVPSSSSSAARALNVTINGIDGDIIGSTATLLPATGGSTKNAASTATLHITLPKLKKPKLKRRVCVQFNDRCPTLSDMCARSAGGKPSPTCQVEMRGPPSGAAAKRTGCSVAGATFSVSSDALVQYDVDFSQNFTRATGSKCPPRAEIKAYLDDLGKRAQAVVQATGDRVVEMLPMGCMPMGLDRALLSGIMVAVGPVGAGARAAAALKTVSAPQLSSGPAQTFFGGGGARLGPEESTDMGEKVKIPDFLSYLGAGFDVSEYYPYPSMGGTSQALNPKQWLRSDPILDRPSLGRAGYTESQVEVCNVKAELKTAKSAQEAKDVLEIEAKASVSTPWVAASASAAYKSAVESTTSSEAMMASSSIDCLVASYELFAVGKYKPDTRFARVISLIVNREERRKEALANGNEARARQLEKQRDDALKDFKKSYGTSFVTRFNLGAFMYMTMQFEGSKMATRVENSKSLEVELSTTFASVSGKVTNEQTRANSLENEAMNSRITASPLAALPTFKPANGGDDYRSMVVDIQAWQADINAARKDPIGRDLKPDVDETNNVFYPFPDTKTHEFLWDWLEESLIYIDADGVGFWDDALGADAEDIIYAFSELYKAYVFRVVDVDKLSKKTGCFPSPLVVKNPNTGKCDSCLESSLFGSRKGYCNPQGTAGCYWNSKNDPRPGCICAPPCYGVNPVTKLRDCYREGGRMHHPWARDPGTCPSRGGADTDKFPLLRDALLKVPRPTDCTTRYTADGSPISDLQRDRVWCSAKSADCMPLSCVQVAGVSRFCWVPPGQTEAVPTALAYANINAQQLAPTVYTVLATGCDKKGKCKFPIDAMRRQYDGGSTTHACKYFSVRNQVDNCSADVDPQTGELRDSLRDPVAKPYFVDLPGPPPGQGSVVWSHVPPSKCLAQIVVPPGGVDADLANWVCKAGQYPSVSGPIPADWDGVAGLGGDFGKLCPKE